MHGVSIYMIDAHCHLDGFQPGDIDAMVQRFKGEMIASGAGVESSRKAVEMAQKYSNVYATVGIHPEAVNESRITNHELWIELENLLKMPKVVAVGECGLDLGGEAEEELLKMHVGLAHELDLPLVIHNRHQDEGILRLVRGRVMMHCFTSDMEMMKKCVARGWYISFGGIITFRKSGYLREVAGEVPEELLLCETDSPYLAPEPVRGSMNKPENVKIVIQKLAEVRGRRFEEMERITSANAKRFFRTVTHEKTA